MIVNKETKRSIAIGVLIVIGVTMAMINILERVEYSKEINRFSDEQNHLIERINEEVIISDNERKMKVISMYSVICGKYGLKYHVQNNIGDNRKYQGLSKFQKADFFLACFNYETMLGIPYFTLVTVAMIETSFNPIAATYWENGSLKEAGIFQHRREAVGQAYLYWKSLQQVNPGMADRLAFNYSQMQDLWDPVNAAKVAAVLLWGLKREFKGEVPYYISALHWGINRVMPYWEDNNDLPRRFVFNEGLKDEDIRNPLVYALLFNELYRSFSKYCVDINIDMTYIDRYRKRCSDVEWQFIDSWQYVKDLREKIMEIEEFKHTAEKEHIEMVEALKAKVEKIDKEYLRILGLTKSGKFNNIKDVFRLWQDAFKIFIAEIRQDKISKLVFMQQIAVTVLLFLIGVLLVVIFILLILKFYNQREIIIFNNFVQLKKKIFNLLKHGKEEYKIIE